MSEIQSIATNNYLLATQQEVSHDNTLSGNGTVDSPLGVVPGYNETVLYDAGTNGITGSSFPIQLAENPANFEYIRIVYRPWTSARFVFDKPGNEDYIILNAVWVNGAMTAAYNFITSFGLSGTTMSFNGNIFMQWGSTAMNTDSSTFRLFKVIGINRKA
jgi:hypothetical protein